MHIDFKACSTLLCIFFSGDYALCIHTHMDVCRERYVCLHIERCIKVILLHHLFSRSLAVRLSFHSFPIGVMRSTTIHLIHYFRLAWCAYDHLFWCFLSLNAAGYSYGLDIWSCSVLCVCLRFIFLLNIPWCLSFLTSHLIILSLLLIYFQKNNSNFPCSFFSIWKCSMCKSFSNCSFFFVSDIKSVSVFVAFQLIVYGKKENSFTATTRYYH